METQTMQPGAPVKHNIETPDNWLKARKALLQKEKEFTRAYDKLRAERLAMPWAEVTKNYVFDSAEGKVSLADLFGGRSQLIIQHFMFGPDWEEGCVGCSFGADHAQAALVHLNNHDVSYVAVSRAPVEKIEAFKKRMGWTFPWVSSLNNNFNFDFHVSFRPEDVVEGQVYYNYSMQPYNGDEAPGDSAFYKDEAGKILHTYSSYARGGENQISTYMILDTAPLGRNEDESKGLTSWVRHHDKYKTNGHVNNQGRFIAEEKKIVAAIKKQVMDNTQCNCRRGPQPLPTRKKHADKKHGKSFIGLIKMAIPAFAFVLIPKCPVCLAGYIAIASGIGVSFTTAAYIRVGLIVLCIVSLCYFIIKYASRWLMKRL